MFAKNLLLLTRIYKNSTGPPSSDSGGSFTVANSQLWMQMQPVNGEKKQASMALLAMHQRRNAVFLEDLFVQVFAWFRDNSKQSVLAE